MRPRRGEGGTLASARLPGVWDSAAARAGGLAVLVWSRCGFPDVRRVPATPATGPQTREGLVVWTEAGAGGPRPGQAERGAAAHLAPEGARTEASGRGGLTTAAVSRRRSRMWPVKVSTMAMVDAMGARAEFPLCTSPAFASSFLSLFRISATQKADRAGSFCMPGTCQVLLPAGRGLLLGGLSGRMPRARAQGQPFGELSAGWLPAGGWPRSPPSLILCVSGVNAQTPAGTRQVNTMTGLGREQGQREQAEAARWRWGREDGGGRIWTSLRRSRRGPRLGPGWG